MEMILLDWTRMGLSYCIAGAVQDRENWQIVRPMMAKRGAVPPHIVGWSPYYLDGFSRWDIFELSLPSPSSAEPPHVEDLWVRALTPRRRSASVAVRAAILQATASPIEGTLFGYPFKITAIGACLNPGTGARSLATLFVPAEEIRFEASFRGGAAEPDVRVKLPIPDLGPRILMVKDHQLLRNAEQSSADLQHRLQFLNQTIRRMGPVVAVRLGLSRAFPPNAAPGQALCWLMADGFFSLADPQP